MMEIPLLRHYLFTVHLMQVKASSTKTLSEIASIKDKDITKSIPKKDLSKGLLHPYYS